MAKKSATKPKTKSKTNINFQEYLDLIKSITLNPIKTLPALYLKKKSIKDLVILSGIFSVLTFIGMFVNFMYNPWSSMFLALQWAFAISLISVVGPFVGSYALTFTDKYVAKKKFGFEELAKIAVYTNLPVLASGILLVIPNLGTTLRSLVGIYGLVLMFLSYNTLKRLDTATSIIQIIIYLVVYSVTAAISLPVLGVSTGLSAFTGF